MIKGRQVIVRTVREADVATLYELRSDAALRGEFMQVNLHSEPGWRKAFEETGLIGSDKGTLVVTDLEGRIVGDVVFFPVNYMDGLEVGFVVYDVERRGRGVMTEALGIVVRWLFDTRRINRLQICTSPENEPAKRLAVRCGFRLEGRLRGHFFHRGRSEDSLVYALLREEA